MNVERSFNVLLAFTNTENTNTLANVWPASKPAQKLDNLKKVLRPFTTSLHTIGFAFTAHFSKWANLLPFVLST
jgi:hypothetical protein